MGEEKIPFLANLPFLGTGNVYATSFMFPSVEGGADVNQPPLDIRFNGAVDPSTAHTQNVQLVGPNDRTLAAEITVRDEGRRIRIVPSRTLAYETEYRIRIGEGLLTAGGLPIFENARARTPGAEFSFRTRRSPPDTDSPFLASSTPADGARGVGGNRPITLVFSEPLDLNTVTGESVRLYDADGNLLAASIVFGGDRKSVTVEPA
ncbi:MAG: Ig-like domain-containing domain, partial [Planctomycetota bacterium]